MSHRRLRAAAITLALATLPLAVSSAHAGSWPAPPLTPVEQARTGAPLERRVLTILANFQEDRAAGSGVAEPITVAEAKDAMGLSAAGRGALGGTNVRNLYWQASGGQLDMVGDVTPWVQLGSRGQGCNAVGWINAAIAAAAAQTSFDPSTYDAVSLIARSRVPGQTNPCVSISGVAPMVGGAYSILNSIFPMTTVAHELGHTLGLKHANTLECTVRGTPVVVAAGCPTTTPAREGETDYGDTDSVMGTVLRLPSAAERARIGLLPLDKVWSIGADDVEYTIDRLGTSLPTGKALVEVLRPEANAAGESASGAWMLEYRQSTAPFDDTNSTDPATTRVAVRLAGPLSGTPTSTLKIVPRPGAGNPTQNANLRGGLRKGDSIHDPRENYTITVTDLTATQAKVRVTPDPTPLTGATATQVWRSGNTLTVLGASGKGNSVAVYEDQGAIIVSDAAQPVLPGAGCRALNSGMAECTATSLSALTLQLGDGDDYASVEDAITVPVRATGGPGADTIDTGGGDDAFLTAAGDGNDSLDGGPGADSVSYAGRPSGIAVTTGGGGEGGESDGFTSIENITGTAYIDVIDFSSDAGANRIDGGGAADTLKSGGGADTVIARDGTQDTAIDCGTSTGDVLVHDAGEPTTNCEDARALPQPEFTGGIAEGAITAVARPTVSFNAPQLGTATLQCAVINAGATVSYGPCSTASSHQPSTDLSNGTYEIWVRAVQGGTPITGAAAIKRTFTVRTTPPDTTLTSTAPNPSRADNSKFVFSSEAGATFECSLDNAAYFSCAPSVTYKPLASGPHTLAVRAVSAAGVADPDPATYSWQVDTTVPDTTISGTPASGSTAVAGGLNWGFSSDDPSATFQCAWTATTPTACGSSTTGDLDPGTYTLKVSAVDAAGNIDPTPATRQITITSQGFNTVIQNPASQAERVSNTRKPTLQFAVTPAASGFTFECRVEGASWTACQSPYQPTFAQEGYQDVAVRAISPQGVVEVVPASEQYIVDLADPQTTVTGGPAAGSTQRVVSVPTSASFAFDAPGDLSPQDCEAAYPANCTTFQCKLDASTTWSPCERTYTASGLTNGSHRLQVRAIDAAGNTDQTPIDRTWTVTDQAHLAITSAANSSSTVPLSSSSGFGALTDWIHWRGSDPATLDRRSGTAVLPTWTLLPAGSSAQTYTGTTTFTWTDAQGSTPSGSSALGSLVGGADGRGFAFALPVSTGATRKLRLHAGVRGANTTGRLTLAWASGGTPVTQDIAVTSSTTLNQRSFTIEFDPNRASDTLQVEWKLAAGGTNAGAAAALFAASLH